MLLDKYYKHLIKPVRDTKILDHLKSLDVDVYSPYDKDFLLSERVESIQELKTLCKEWTKNTIFGLEKFPYIYVVNGNTDWLNILFASSKGSIGWRKGDYTYYKVLATGLDKEFIELETPQYVDNLIVSWPGYAFGDSTELDFANKCNAKNKHLDVAYLGTTYPITADVSNFESVAITFSKTLAIPYNRIALVFSNTSIKHLETMNSIGYVNLSGVRIVNSLLPVIDINYFWNQYSNLYYKICDEHTFTASKCMLTAYKNSQRISIGSYYMEHIKND